MSCELRLFVCAVFFFASHYANAAELGADHQSRGANISWLSPVDDDWEDPQAWDQMRIPNLFTDQPTLGLIGQYSVTSVTNASYSALNITNPDATLRLYEGSHTSAMGIFNDGTLQVGRSDRERSAAFQFGTDAVIAGNGVIRLESRFSPSEARLFGLLQTVTQASTHRIEGNGELIMFAFQNEGAIEARGSGVMRLLGNYMQAQTGTIGANATELLLGDLVRITGGTLESLSGGQFILDGSKATIADLVNNADISHLDGPHELRIQGATEHNGLITLDSSGDASGLKLVMEDDSILSGSGTIRMLGAADTYPEFSITTSGTATIEAGVMIESNSSLILSSGSSLNFNGSLSILPDVQPFLIRGDIRGSGAINAVENSAVFGNLTYLDGLDLISKNGHEFLIQNGAVTMRDIYLDGVLRFEDDNETLSIRGSLINEGSIIVGQSIDPRRNHLNFVGDTEILGSGSIVLRSDDQDFRIVEVEGGVARLGPDAEISGYGVVFAGFLNGTKLVNEGIIRSSGTVAPLILLGNYETNGGRYISAGAGLQFDGEIKDALLEVGDGTLYRALGARFVRARIEGELLISGLSELGGVNHNENLIVLESGSELRFDLGSQLVGEGLLIMEPGSRITSVSGSGIRPVIGANQIIRGSGAVELSARLQGTIIADNPSEPLVVDSNLVGEGGEMVADGAELQFDDTCELFDMVLRSINAGVTTVPRNAELEADTLLNDSDLRLLPGSYALFSTILQNDGRIVIGDVGKDVEPNFVEFSRNCSLTGEGIIELVVAETQDVSECALISRVGNLTIIGSGQSIEGSGRLIGDFELHGSLRPAGAHRLMQVLNVNFASDAVCRIELGGTEDGEFAKINQLLGGLVDLDGVLVIELDVGYEPSFGDTWEIFGQQSNLVQGQITGSFADVQTPASPQNRRYVLNQDDHYIRLVYTCASDLNGDLSSDFFDVTKYISAFSQSDPIADFDQDGDFDFYDVSAFLVSFQGGCQ